MRKFRLAVAVTSIATGFVGITFWYRPLPDYSSGEHGPPPRKDAGFISSLSMTDMADKKEPILLNVAKRISSFINVSVFRFLMTTFGKVRIVKDQNYQLFLENVVHRPDKVSMITVSNHRSMADDPGAMSCILPYWIAIHPKYVRWSLCAQDFCYHKNFPHIFYGLCGSFKVLPMWRGGGINQKLLYDYNRLCSAGEWLHFFPEGGVWQLDSLGGRKNSNLGKLKWGVGKLIAHAAIPPVVIPINFDGTEMIVPQDPDTKKPYYKYPLGGHKVAIQVGEVITFDDIIEKHERKYGPVRKFGLQDNKEDVSQPQGWFHQHWDSQPHEYELYHDIASRIEEKLESLGKEARKQRY